MSTPTDPTDPANVEAAERLRTSLAARAAAEPGTSTDDGMTDLRRRIDGTSDLPAPTPLPTATRSRSTVLRWAAAIVVVAALGAGIAVAVRHGGDDDPAQQVRAATTTATGFVIPRRLPDGWRVTNVEFAGVTPQAACPCTLTTWYDPPTRRLIGVETAPSIRDRRVPADAVDLADGTNGWWVAGSGRSAIAWDDQDGARTTVRGNDRTSDTDVLAAAKALSADPSADPGDGFMQMRRTTSPRVDQQPRVALTIETRTAPISMTLQVPTTYDEAESPFPGAGIIETTDPALILASSGATQFTEAAFLPDAVATFFRSGVAPGSTAGLPPDSGQAMTDFRNGLTEATAEEWATFVRSVGLFDPEVIAPTLAQVAAAPQTPQGTDPEAPATTESSTTAPSPTTTITTTSWGQFQVGSGMTIESADRPERYTDLTGLRFDVSVDQGSAVAGRPVRARLRATNTTGKVIDLSECTIGEIQVGLVRAGTTDGPLARRDLIDCYDTTVASVPAHGTWVQSFDDRQLPELLARRVAPATAPADSDPYLGSLEPGSYHVIVVIPGRTSTVHVDAGAIDVTPHPCGIPDEVVGWFPPGTTLDAARTIAADHDYEFRVVSRDGKPVATSRDLRCKRIDAIVDADRIQSIDIG